MLKIVQTEQSEITKLVCPKRIILEVFCCFFRFFDILRRRMLKYIVL